MKMRKLFIFGLIAIFTSFALFTGCGPVEGEFTNNLTEELNLPDFSPELEEGTRTISYTYYGNYTEASPSSRLDVPHTLNFTEYSTSQPEIQKLTLYFDDMNAWAYTPAFVESTWTYLYYVKGNWYYAYPYTAAGLKRFCIARKYRVGDVATETAYYYYDKY